MTHICTYCNKGFTTKSYLNYHQKHTKYCLEIQGKYQNNIFRCNYCNKILSSEKRLQTHYDVCIDYIINKTEMKYKEKIQDLTEEIVFK